MKKIIFLFLIFNFFSNCSFNNNSGIWKSKDSPKEKYTFSKNLKDIFPQKVQLEKEISPKEMINLSLSPLTENLRWEDPLFNQNNNFNNYYFSNNFKTQKIGNRITRKTISKNILFKENKVIFFDNKGRVGAYSLLQNKVTFDFNFYQKKYKRKKIKLFATSKDNLIFITDNLGYIYCINLDKEKLVWAKNYKIPFSSNIKISNNVILAVNENNNIMAFNSKNGEKIWNFLTDKNLLQTSFINNLALEGINLYALNTNGSLYSINSNTTNLNWIANFKEVIGNQSSNIFMAYPLIISDDKILISTDKSISLYNLSNGVEKWQLDVSIKINPIFSKDFIFLITKNNFLICLNSNNGTILWSQDISNLLKKSLVKPNLKKIGNYIDLKIADNKILIFTDKAKIIQIDPYTSKVVSLNEISNKLGSKPLFLNKNIYYLDNKNRFIEIN